VFGFYLLYAEIFEKGCLFIAGRCCIMEMIEKVLSSETKFEGRIFTVHVDDVELPNGAKSKREIVEHNGGVGIIAVDKDKNVFVVNQYRVVFSEIVTEIPAGKVEKGEDPYDCGVRELEEETGYCAKKFEHLGTFYPTPGYCHEKINIYLATELYPTKQNLDEGEFLEVKKIPLDTLYDMVMQNKIYDAKTVVAVLKAKAILG